MFGTYCRLNVAVYASAREVIRATRRRMNPEALRDRSLRELRHARYREMLEYHRRSQDLCAHFRI